MTTRRVRRIDWLAVWILWSAWSSLVGWTLSYLGGLDRFGYAISTLLFLVLLFVSRRRLSAKTARPLFLLRRSTYRRLLPRLWLTLTLLALLGGFFYHPDNYDYLTYRFPRILHWTWEHHWQWVIAPNDRQNFSAVGMEWLMTPLFVFTQSDRFFFLINVVSFLFLPGLTYAVFRRLGVSPRVAWSWMWILPTGLCYLLQSGGMGNDLFAGIYLLAGFYYAFTATTVSPLLLALSIISMALLTDAKASNIPLVLPWFLVLWHRRSAVLASMRPMLLVLTVAIVIVVSFMPIALANIYYTGSYTGDPHDKHKVLITNPIIGIIGNSIEILGAAFEPPLWPHDFHWPGEAILQHAFSSDYPRFSINGVPLAIEENAGIGLGVSLFGLLSLYYGLRYRARRSRSSFVFALFFIGATFTAAAAYMAKLGSEAAPRLFAPYYLIVLASMLAVLPADGQVIRRWPWTALACAIFALAVPILVLNPSRPLLPSSWILGGLRVAHVPSAAIGHLEDNYRLHQTRRDGLASLRARIPSGENVIGIILSGDDPAVSGWIPFGTRQAYDLKPSDDPAALGIRYLMVSTYALEVEYHTTLATLMTKWPNAKILAQMDLTEKTGREKATWYLLKVD